MQETDEDVIREWPRKQLWKELFHMQLNGYRVIKGFCVVTATGRLCLVDGHPGRTRRPGTRNCAGIDGVRVRCLGHAHCAWRGLAYSEALGSK